MNELAEPSFLLLHIHRCGADEQNQPSQQVNTLAVATATTSGSSYTTEVLLKVGVLASSSPSDSFSCTSSQVPVCYLCPAYILQAGCPTLRELLADAFEGGSSGMCGADDEAGANSAAAVALPSPHPVVIPLPFLDREVFEVVALYLEHFYALDFTISTGTTATAPHPSVTSLVTSSARAPSSLQRPLNFQDLYTLSMWEQYYVLCQLLGLERPKVDSLRLMECGVWVDLIGGVAAVPLPKGKTPLQRQVNVAHGTLLSQQRADCFSLANRRRMWSRLCHVLEAALRLGMPTLRLLCATVAADMLVDLDEAGLARLMQPSGDGSDTISIPPFTAQARAQVLHRFPWLKPE